MQKTRKQYEKQCTEFKTGFCQYRAKKIEQIPGRFFKTEDWQDGYYAFSHREVRKRDLDKLYKSNPRNANLFNNVDLLNERMLLDGTATYIMEIGLWRTDGNNKSRIYEEVSLERDEDFFFLQEWQLFTGDEHDSESLRCYYRCADTVPDDLKGKEKLFNDNDLKSMEIIIPGKRLHFFLTTGEIQS